MIRRSAAEVLLAVQLEQDGIPFVREYPFAAPNRKWRSDFCILGDEQRAGPTVDFLVEIDGGSWVGGRHVTGSGFEADLEKLNAAALLGYRCLRFTPAQVEDGRALAVIRQALGMDA